MGVQLAVEYAYAWEKCIRVVMSRQVGASFRYRGGERSYVCSKVSYMGRPAKAVRALTEEEIAYLRYSAEHYMRVKDNYLKGSAPGDK